MRHETHAPAQQGPSKESSGARSTDDNQQKMQPQVDERPSRAPPNPAGVIYDDEECHNPNRATTPLCSSGLICTRIRVPFLNFTMDRDTFYACISMGISALAFALQSLNVKQMSAYTDFWTISVFRGLGGGVACLGSYLATRQREEGSILGKRENGGWLVLRGLLGAVATIAAFAGLSAMDLAIASVIMSTAPLWTAALIGMIERGTWSHFDTLAAVACTAGMVVILKPGFSDLNQGTEEDSVMPDGMSTGFKRASHSHGSPQATAVGVMLSLISAMACAGVNVVIRRIRTESAAVVTLYPMIATLILASPGMVYEQRRGAEESWMQQRELRGYLMVRLMMTGLLSFCAEMTKTGALQKSKSAGVLVMRYLDIVFAFVFDILILEIRQDWLSILGASIIVGSCLVSAVAQAARA